MDYYEMRQLVKMVIPRRSQLPFGSLDKVGAVREKGRKSNYYQFNLGTQELRKNERLLNTDEVNSFVEVSLRAVGCPMPLNLDVYDGLRCGYGCRYCYADAFRASLYTSFFDNSRSIGVRHCNPTYYKKELDKLMKIVGTDPKQYNNEIKRAFAKMVPLRFGIRFEDFMAIEKRLGVSLELLKYLAEAQYPVMINTKSDLLGDDDYIRALADNPARSAVHVTLISSDDSILKRLEPGAPSYKRRLASMAAMAGAGVRVVARIEPYMVFINDRREDVERYIEDVWDAGVRHITFDTYSYSANNPGIRQSFFRQGFDFERMFLLTSDSQAIGSLLLSKFMDLFRAKGFSCSTFDLGSSTSNDDRICCEVGDWFDAGFNEGSVIPAIQFIKSKAPAVVSWTDYEDFVNRRGGFLSEKLRKEMLRLWNRGEYPFSIVWAQGIRVVGNDSAGLLWRYDPDYDFREELFLSLI